MRMAGPDIVLFLVGALLFTGATAAIVTRDGGLDAFGGGGSALGFYSVAYTTAETAVGEAASVSFDSGEASFDVNQTNVANLIVVIECSGDVPGPAAFTITLTVTPPASSGLTVEPQQIGCSNQEVVIPVTAVPETGTVRGGSEAEARENLGQDANATRAQGTWTVAVSGSRGGGPATIPGLPAGTPTGTIATKVETWEPAFTPVQQK